MSTPPRTRKVEVVVRIEIICAEDQEEAIYAIAGAMAKKSEALVNSATNTVIVLANQAAELGDRPTPFFVEAIVYTMPADADDKAREQFLEAERAAKGFGAHYHPEGNA